MRGQTLRRFGEPQMPKLIFKLRDGCPGKYGGALALVRWVGRQAVRPAAMPNQWKQRSLVEPCKADLGNRARATANDDAGVSRQSHQKVAGIAHARGNDDRGRPIRWRHHIRRDDADNQTAGMDGSLGCDASSGTAASADDRDAVASKKGTCVAGKFECGGAGLSTAEHA